MDRLNYNNDPQYNGDGFFDFVENLTMIPQTGKIIFTKVEPFGEFLFESLRLDFSEDYNGDQNNLDDYNPNQKKYVYHTLYNSTKTAAEQAAAARRRAEAAAARRRAEAARQRAEKILRSRFP